MSEARRRRSTVEGSPLGVKSPRTAGEAELRYRSGQGSKVLARRPLQTIP